MLRRIAVVLAAALAVSASCGAPPAHGEACTSPAPGQAPRCTVVNT